MGMELRHFTRHGLAALAALALCVAPPGRMEAFGGAGRPALQAERALDRHDQLEVQAVAGVPPDHVARERAAQEATYLDYLHEVRHAAERIQGEGEAGLRGGPPGDLYVVIYIEEHPFFQRQVITSRLRPPLRGLRNRRN